MYLFAHSFRRAFAVLSRTNDSPSEDERRMLTHALSGPERELKAVREEIEQLRGRLISLVDDENRLATSLQQYQSILSSFRRLPDDIIREILLTCLPAYHNPLVSAREFPTLLSHVSRHTRAVALSTPRLWAAMHIPLAHSQDAMERQTDAVKQWLRRAGGCYLTISVYEPPGSERVTDEHTYRLFQTIVASSARWKSLSLHCSFITLRRFLNSLNECTDLRCLRTFSMEVSSRLRRGEDPQTLYNDSALAHAPCLQDLKLHTSTSTCSYKPYNVRWDYLTHLSLGSSNNPVRMACAGEILRRTTQLRTSQLYMVKYAELPAISLPHLTSMSLAFAEEEWMLETPHACTVFAGMHLPALERIVCDAAHGIMPLLGLITGAEGRIRHLTLENPRSPLYLVVCLRRCPSLISLGVRNVGDSLALPMLEQQEEWKWYADATPQMEYLFSALTPSDAMQDDCCPSVERLCKQLEYLSIVDRRTTLSQRYAQLFIAAKCSNRYKEYGRLKGLRVDIGSDGQSFMLSPDDFNAEVAAGLKLSITQTAPDFPPSGPVDDGIICDTCPSWWP